MVFSRCFLGYKHTVGEKEASTVYQLNGLEVRFDLPQSAPKQMGRREFWYMRQRGRSQSVVPTEDETQVKVRNRGVIIDPMNQTVDDTQYRFVQFLNRTVFYETNWTTLRLGSQQCAF